MELVPQLTDQQLSQLGVQHIGDGVLLKKICSSTSRKYLYKIKILEVTIHTQLEFEKSKCGYAFLTQFCYAVLLHYNNAMMSDSSRFNTG